MKFVFQGKVQNATVIYITRDSDSGDATQNVWIPNKGQHSYDTGNINLPRDQKFRVGKFLRRAGPGEEDHSLSSDVIVGDEPVAAFFDGYKDKGVST